MRSPVLRLFRRSLLRKKKSKWWRWLAWAGTFTGGALILFGGYVVVTAMLEGTPQDEKMDGFAVMFYGVLFLVFSLMALERNKRPASHRCVVAFYTLMLMMFVVFGIEDEFPYRWMWGIPVIPAVLLAGAVFAPKSRWNYVGGVASLWPLCGWLCYRLKTLPDWYPLSDGATQLAGAAAFSLFLALVTCAYTFGMASWKYFGYEPR